MRKKYVKLMAAGMFILTLMAGCGPNGSTINDRANGTVSKDADNSGYHEGEQESRNDTKLEENKNSQSQPQTTASAEEIEKELAAYRTEREKNQWNKGGLDYGMAPNEENYKYGVADMSHVPEFDSRELNMVFKTAGTYVRETLKLDEVWECVDPRMLAIYEDEDKGVADGYEAENIFLCEYNDNGKWQYLILVREGKGSDWNVLYHGSSYKT